MLRCLDPNATWTYELLGQGELPTHERVRLRCRYLTVSQLFAHRELRLESSRIRADQDALDCILRALRMAVVSVENVPASRETVPGLAVVAPAPVPGNDRAPHDTERSVAARPRDGGGDDVQVLFDLLTISQLFDLVFRLELEQQLAEIELGKSELPSPGETGASAPRAQEAAGA